MEIIYSTSEYRTVIEIPDGREAEVLSYCDRHFGFAADKDRADARFEAMMRARK